MVLVLFFAMLILLLAAGSVTSLLWFAVLAAMAFALGSAAVSLSWLGRY